MNFRNRIYWRVPGKTTTCNDKEHIIADHYRVFVRSRITILWVTCSIIPDGICFSVIRVV